MFRTILASTVSLVLGVTASLTYQAVFVTQTQVQQVSYTVEVCPTPTVPDVLRPVETTHQAQGRLLTAPILGEQ